ncbi:MAG TPA: YeeE/YedE thiosulfate transporter family protein [Burkholderiales bacterium]
MGNFTPVSALAGGLLIGAAASLLLWLNGRIAGVSNITAGLLSWKRGDVLWRLLFLGGLVAGAAIYYRAFGNAPVARPEFPAWLLAAGGLLVGFGTSFGSGCTSGHGVCGLGRLSMRSLMATVIFLVTGIATTFVVRHGFGVY